MFVVGSTFAKMPQKAGSCSGQEVFKSAYFVPVPQRGEIQALPTQKHSSFLDLRPLLPVSLGAHMLVRECELFAKENRGRCFPRQASVSKARPCCFSSSLRAGMGRRDESHQHHNKLARDG